MKNICQSKKRVGAAASFLHQRNSAVVDFLFGDFFQESYCFHKGAVYRPCPLLKQHHVTVLMMNCAANVNNISTSNDEHPPSIKKVLSEFILSLPDSAQKRPLTQVRVSGI